MRYNLEVNDNLIDINKELEQVKAYVEIEKARFGDKLTVLYDIDENIRAGVSILKGYLDDCNGDIAMALMAYNAGPGTMMNRGVISSEHLYKMPLETQNYVPKVLTYYDEYNR